MPRRWFPDEEDTPSSRERAANLLGALAVGLSDRLEEVMATSTGSSASGAAALQTLSQVPGLRLDALRFTLALSQEAVTRLVARLVKEGLVLKTEDPRDRRAVMLRASALGTTRALRARMARARVTRALVDRLPEVWIPRFIRISERLLAGLAESPEAAVRVCRFCAWEVCRADARTPCPVVLAATTHDWPSGPPVVTFDGERVYQDRRVIDGADPPIELWLEPGGAAFRLPASRRLEILCRGAQHGHLEVERLPEGHLALYAWPGATFTVLEAGREIFVEERALSLSTATGSTTREKVESLYGDLARRRRLPETRWR